jgi:hypothetical protein
VRLHVLLLQFALELLVLGSLSALDPTLAVDIDFIQAVRRLVV